VRPIDPHPQPITAVKRLALVVVLLFVAKASGVDVNLDWIENGMFGKVGYYRPVRTDLSPSKPARVTRIPGNLSRPLFGTIAFGPRDAPVEVVVLLDEPDGGGARLWIDRNGNGDLTDDPPVEWVGRQNNGKSGPVTTWFGGVQIPVRYGSETHTLGIKLYRFDRNDPQRQQMKNALFYYRDFGFAGNLSFDGRTLAAALVDDSAQGDFRGNSDEAHPDVLLLIDLKNNGKFDFHTESFDVHKPFNIGGTTYEIAGLTAAGGRFQLVKSSKTVAETPVPPSMETGGRPAAFEETSTTGRSIRFPSDYRGKLVMIDFWATWCGPCRAELPNLIKVYDEFHAKGFEVVGVSLDNEQTIPGLAKFTADNHMPWQQVCDGKGWEAKLAHLYGVHSIPACWLIDGNTGLIVAGENDLRGTALRPTIERCLAGLGKSAAAPTPASVVKNEEAPASRRASEDPIVPRARELARSRRFLTPAEFERLLKSPTPAPVAMPAAGTQSLRGREIAERAARAYVRVGWIYHCSKCGRWHARLAGGYAIAGKTVATAFHVMAIPETISQGEGYPVVVRGDDEFLPIIGVLAADEAIDAVILKVAATDLHPLALAASARIGDAAYCFSDPRGVRGYFSSGIVNRFYTRPGGSPDRPSDQRLNVSTDWAPGSSGAAILDECGNVIGHVARIQSFMGEKLEDDSDDHAESTTPTLMTLHEAVPAGSVLKLIEKMNNAAVTK
jgi:thiol-disulfide isomerase/thioredoxin